MSRAWVKMCSAKTFGGRESVNGAAEELSVVCSELTLCGRRVRHAQDDPALVNKVSRVL